MNNKCNNIDIIKLAMPIIIVDVKGVTWLSSRRKGFFKAVICMTIGSARRWACPTWSPRWLEDVRGQT